MKKSKKNVAGPAAIYLSLNGVVEKTSNGSSVRIAEFSLRAIILNNGKRTDSFGLRNGLRNGRLLKR